MLSRVWAVCATERERERQRIGERNRKRVIISLKQTVSKPPLPFCQEMRLTLKLRAGRHRRSLPVFQTPHHVLLEKNFFPCLCVTSLKSSSAQTLHELPLFLQRLLGVESKRRNLFRFSYENLWCRIFEVVALRIFGEKFLRLVWGCWNLKDNWACTWHPSSVT